MKPSVKLKSLVMGLIVSDRRRRLQRLRYGLTRRLRGRPPCVHYFHQVEDPYSHIVVQKLAVLAARYRVRFCVHLTSAPLPEFQGDESRFYLWALRDARDIAAFYGAELPGEAEGVDAVDSVQADNAVSQLAGVVAGAVDGGVNRAVDGAREVNGAVDAAAFGQQATALGDKLWRGQTVEPGTGDPVAARASGDATREHLGHYLSATFYFEGEWYWGPDRLYHLEQRLTAMGLSREPTAPLCVPRPIAEPITGKGADIMLEYFPSLRSPYSAISFSRTLDLVQRSGVSLRLKPVMPMMMRGVPAPRAKQLYIMRDTKREAQAAGIPFGKIVDPFGEPVKRAFSLLPHLRSIGKDVEFVGSYLRAAWAEGIDITTDAGLKVVVERAGVDWGEASEHLGAPGYMDLLEA
ncbi:MAG: DsbA family protein, partial [Pseudomonadales bacterium]